MHRLVLLSPGYPTGGFWASQCLRVSPPGTGGGRKGDNTNRSKRPRTKHCTNTCWLFYQLYVPAAPDINLLGALKTYYFVKVLNMVTFFTFVSQAQSSHILDAWWIWYLWNSHDHRNEHTPGHKPEFLRWQALFPFPSKRVKKVFIGTLCCQQLYPQHWKTGLEPRLRLSLLTVCVPRKVNLISLILHFLICIMGIIISTSTASIGDKVG